MRMCALHLCIIVILAKASDGCCNNDWKFFINGNIRSSNSYGDETNF